MIEVPLILIGYVLVLCVALLVMVMADQPHQTTDQSTFPQIEIL